MVLTDVLMMVVMAKNGDRERIGNIESSDCYDDGGGDSGNGDRERKYNSDGFDCDDDCGDDGDCGCKNRCNYVRFGWR